MIVAANKITSLLKVWVDSNYLKINASKTKATFFTPVNEPLSTSTSIGLENVEMEFMTGIKTLGAIVSSRLTWDDHVSYILT